MFENQMDGTGRGSSLMTSFVPLLLIWTALIASGDGLLVNITTGNQTVKVGDRDVKMSCRVNKGLPLLYNNYVQWLHVSNATGSSTETLLTTNTQIKANRSEYSVDFQYAGQYSTITLNLKTVRSEMDGTYVCRVLAGTTTVSETKTDVTVYSDIDHMEMTVDGQAARVAQTELSVGRHVVRCTAVGLNPGQPSSHIVVLALGPAELALTHVASRLDPRATATAGARRYRAMYETVLQLEPRHAGKSLTCRGKHSSFLNARSTTTSLKIFFYFPQTVLECPDVWTWGQTVTLTCTVRFRRSTDFAMDVGCTGSHLTIRPQFRRAPAPSVAVSSHTSHCATNLSRCHFRSGSLGCGCTSDNGTWVSEYSFIANSSLNGWWRCTVGVPCVDKPNPDPSFYRASNCSNRTVAGEPGTAGGETTSTAGPGSDEGGSLTNTRLAIAFVTAVALGALLGAALSLCLVRRGFCGQKRAAEAPAEAPALSPSAAARGGASPQPTEPCGVSASVADPEEASAAALPTNNDDPSMSTESELTSVASLVPVLQ